MIGVLMDELRGARQFPFSVEFSGCNEFESAYRTRAVSAVGSGV
jgi:hypothetical protein